MLSSCLFGIQFEMLFCWYVIRSVGEHLSSIEQVHVITGGFYGVGDVVGRSYHEKRCEMGRPSNIWHVLPKHDSQVAHMNILTHVTMLMQYVLWPSVSPCVSLSQESVY